MESKDYVYTKFLVNGKSLIRFMSLFRFLSDCQSGNKVKYNLLSVMKVSVLFFGATADEVGTRELEIDFAEDAKAGDAFREIVDKFPRLANHKLLFAVNQEYASGGETIKDGDELAVFTAVSGG